MMRAASLGICVRPPSGAALRDVYLFGCAATTLRCVRDVCPLSCADPCCYPLCSAMEVTFQKTEEGGTPGG